MRHELNFWVVGGDMRQAKLAEQLSDDGHTVHTYALDRAPEPVPDPQDSLEDAVLADCVILPLPTAGEGGMLNAPMSGWETALEEVMDALRPGQVVCAGRVTPELEALAERIPRVAGVCRAQAENPWLSVFLLRLAGASPGDVVSLYLGASGTPYGTYLSAGLLGGLPRIACATVLGGALWQPGSGRFWLSLAAGGALTALSGVIWLLWRRRRRA